MLRAALFEHRKSQASADAALAWGELRAQLDAKGSVLGALDTMIAAHALSRGATLATTSPKAFRAVSGLKVESWVR